MKKLLAILLCGAMLASFAVGCGKKDDNVSDSNNNQDVTVDETTFDKVVQGIKDEYGDDYIPSMKMDDQMFADATGVNMDNVEKYYAETPMISAQVDTFIAVQAKEGKGEEVEKELNAYRDRLVNDTMQYPMNVAKVQSSEVVRHGDYVYFVMLGKFNEDENADDKSALEFAKAETKRGLDKIASFFNM